MTKQQILFVDNEKDLVEMMKMSFEYEGYDVSVACDGKEALDKLSESKPDMVVMDVVIPKIDGWEVLSQIRSNPETNHLPVIILTSKSEEISKLLGYKLGADDYITKPFSTKELFARVGSVLRRYKQSYAFVPEKKVNAKIPVLEQSTNGVKFVNQEDVVHISAVRNYTYIHTNDEKHLSHFNLSGLEGKLEVFFFRVHRSYIVNLHKVEAIFSPAKSSYKIQLNDKGRTQIPVSRNKVKDLKSNLGM
jgi:DNA-binding response OmpR family regulator